MAAHNKVTPNNILTLFRALDGDVSQVAARMGIHPSTVSRAIHESTTTLKQEARANNALQSLFEKQEEAKREDAAQTQFFVEVPTDKINGFKRVAQAMGVELVGL